MGEAGEFLSKWRPDGPWILTAISLDKQSIITKTFDDLALVDNFVSEHEGIRNIYFTVNRTISSVNKKPMKEVMLAGDWLHVDIDPKEGADIGKERGRILSLLMGELPEGIPEPTVVIDSGGGYQAFWKLKTPVIVDGRVQLCEEFEAYNRRLEQVFGGDNCHNIDRIMRLPGTTNIPDAKKQKKGRTKRKAVALKFEDLKYELSDFKPAGDIQNLEEKKDTGFGIEVDLSEDPQLVHDLDVLDGYNADDSLRISIAQGRDPDIRLKGDNSRSAWLWRSVCRLVEIGVPDDIIYGIITNEKFGISESVIEQKNPKRYAIRQIKKAKEHGVSPHLMQMNERHAVIGSIGGKCRIIQEEYDESLNRSRVTISSFADIGNRYNNQKVKIGENKDGASVTIPLGKWWLNHQYRRQYDYMRFSPGKEEPGLYNLWRGFAVLSKPGDCSLYLDHLENNVCSGSKEVYWYLIRWMARCVQQPDTHGETAIVLRGKKGVGKSIVATIFGRLFGRHYMQISNSEHLVGKFNAHLRDVSLLFADEAFYAGDRKHESVLKMLITEKFIPIEHKGLDVEPSRSYIHLIMAANDPHVIRASGDERRYLVLEVSDNKIQDSVYFGNMIKQMDNGGCEALLYYLQSIDLEGYEVRDIPQTDALMEQKLLSLNVEEEWWFNKLQEGRLISDHDDWNEEVMVDTIVDDFISYADNWKISKRGNQTSLGRFLKRVVPHLGRVQKPTDYEEVDAGRVYKKTGRKYFYQFGTLQECRDSWKQAHGLSSWEDIQFINSQKKKTPF